MSDADETERSPFNNPFAANLKKLKRRVASAARARPPVRKSGPSDDEPLRERDDAEVFRDAVGDAVPLEVGSGREVAARRGHQKRLRQRAQRVDLAADEHFDVRFSDQFIRGRCQGISHETLTKLERGEFAVRSHIDLHGMAFDDARDAVDDFLSSVQRRGERCALVITGKGRNSPGQVGVLRERIPPWLARGPSARRVLAFVTARPCDGGEGALYVLLRRESARKQRIEVESGGGA